MNWIAQAFPDASWASSLTGPAVLAVVVHWLMIRNEKRVLGLEQAINRLIRANMTMVVVTKQANEALKDEARKILSELEDMDKNTNP
jgi:hypothetical protein